MQANLAFVASRLERVFEIEIFVMVGRDSIAAGAKVVRTKGREPWIMFNANNRLASRNTLIGLYQDFGNASLVSDRKSMVARVIA